MPRSLISLGANLGHTYETMLAASRMLFDRFGGSRVRFSQLYRTPAVGGPTGQSDFLNAVATIDSEWTCWEIWEAIKRIELDLGRQRIHRWEARRIDIDLLIHGKDRIWTPHLKVPHPRMCMRTFVLIPANEIAPDTIDPVTGFSMAKLYEHVCINPHGPTIVVCNTQELADDLTKMLEGSASQSTTRAIQIVTCTSPKELGHSLDSLDPKLVIVCASTPDPESIQWEDFSRSWAEALGLTAAVSTASVHGPRYLLPANDRQWAAHEVASAIEAMRCPVHRSDLVFKLEG